MRKFIIAALAFVILVVPGLAQEPLPDTNSIETAHTAWKAKATKKTRKAFDAALEAYDGPPTTATVKAHLARLNHDISIANSTKLRKTAIAVGEHLEPASDVLPQFYTDARMIAAIALFNRNQSRDSLIEMAHVEGWVRRWRKSQPEEIGETLLDTLMTLEYRAMAWSGAMGAYFESTSNRGPRQSELDAIYASYEVEDDPTDEIARELPFCKGTFVQEPRIRYKGIQAMDHKFGSVIATFEFNSEGKVSNLDIPAAVPIAEFEENAMKAISQWYWKADASEIVGETCSLDRKNVLQPVVFALH